MQEQTIVQIDHQGRIVLPKALRHKNQKYFTCLAETDGTVHLIPVVGVITPKQLYFWSKRWQKGEKQASQDLRKGRCKTIAPGRLNTYLNSL